MIGKRQTHLDDFLVRTPSEKFLLHRRIRMKANSVGYSAIRKAPDALPCFGIPEFNVAVV